MDSNNIFLTIKAAFVAITVFLGSEMGWLGKVIFVWVLCMVIDWASGSAAAAAHGKWSRATATGRGLDPTAYSGTDNTVGIYGTKPVTEPDKTAQDLAAVPNSQLNTIQLVSLAPLTDEQMRQADSLAEALGLTDAGRYDQLRIDETHFAAVFSVSRGDAIKVLALAQKNGWDKLERYHSRFVG